MITILALAGAGLIVNLLGRWLILHEDQSLTRGKRWIVALVPGAELIFILFRWERARGGSVVCALSFALVLPLAGQFSLLMDEAKRADAAGTFSGRIQEIFTGEVTRAQKAEQAAAREKAIALKRAKLDELEAYLHEWYALLEQRRGYLCDEMPEETLVFNRDVAAYHGLLAASKVELGKLQELTKGSPN